MRKASALFAEAFQGEKVRSVDYTDIQLKTLSRRIEVFNMKIMMRRDSDIFYSENIRIDNAKRRCL